MPRRIKTQCYNCGMPTHNIKFCSRHCAGVVNVVIQNTPEKFWSQVDKSGDCWIWRGKFDPQGYGVGFLYGFSNGQATGAHRVAYYLVKGEIPKGLVLDHLCRNHPCVNPSHLEAVTQHENQRRSPISQMSKTHCLNGHVFNKFNTRYSVHDKTGGIHRVCRWCANIRHGLSTKKYEEYAQRVQKASNLYPSRTVTAGGGHTGAYRNQEPVVQRLTTAQTEGPGRSRHTFTRGNETDHGDKRGDNLLQQDHREEQQGVA